MFDISNRLGGLAVAATLAFGLAGVVQAATITVHANSTQLAGNMADMFAPNYAANTPVGATWTTYGDPTVDNPPLTVNLDYKSPFLNTPLADTQTYFAADTRNASNGNGITTQAELTYATAQSTFKMLWGSVDKSNVISFFLGAVPVFSYTGNDLATLLGLTPPGPAPGSFEEVVLLSFGDFDGGFFDRITFTASNRPAFEFALPEAAVIPVPAAGLLLVTALGGMAVLRRRKAAA